jgi:hypothetical protein
MSPVRFRVSPFLLCVLTWDAARSPNGASDTYPAMRSSRWGRSEDDG